jgi:hypothetical protein
MRPVQTVSDVFAAIQSAKAGAAEFCTNFFPVQATLQEWIAHGELLSSVHDGASFFLRRDRDFWHLYFCAASPAALRREGTQLEELRLERVVTDLVGTESTLAELQGALESVGLRPHARLQRMSRTGGHNKPVAPAEGLQITLPSPSASSAVVSLIESAFDCYTEQIPVLYEVEAAIRAGKILVAESSGQMAGLLFFETQGFASTIRFWVVAERFRALRVGSALMAHYFEAHSTVRRFTLWVNTRNHNAMQKYAHYGYAPDGLVDQIMVNQMVTA